MKVKRDKLLYILLPAAAALIGIICMAAFLIISDNRRTDQYYEQLHSARRYVTDGDYEQVITAYRAAIDLRPEDPQAYAELAEVYMDQGQYVQASEWARLGLEKTGDRQFETLLARLEIIRFDRSVAGDGDSLKQPVQAQTSAKTDDYAESPGLALRTSTVDMVADYCYQEYVYDFGAADITYVSDAEGYRAKFGGFNGWAYFKNMEGYGQLIDEITRVPEKNARPYKVVLAAPSVLFVSYGGYISYERLCRMFGTDAAPGPAASGDGFCLSFSYKGCDMIIETDEAGNVTAEKPLLVLSPQSLVKEDWVEETESQETEVETFMLGGRRYTYDVTSITIYGENLSDLSPLAQCTYLKELVLEECTFGSLGPLAGCGALEILELRGSTGFSDLSPLSSLTRLRYLDLHGCSDVSDISPIMGLALELLHTCETGVTFEQTMAYKEAHPDCEVWYDNHPIS